ncbi:PilW family protein [Vreelandella arcis]|nr:prepilin-type N-terminal cleavage/methylation domain-containing protein [Halomonas arcis]
MPSRRQTGFTLVELMVAMAIGTIIILGAGQLFLTTFQTFQKVDELNRKQETVIFATSRLVNAYRKGETGYTLAKTTDIPNECSIRNSSGEPIVGGLALYEGECSTERFVRAGELTPGEPIEGYHRFTLDFKRDDGSLESLSFHTMERQKRSCLPGGNEEGDAFLAGSRVPSPVSFIDSMQGRDEVLKTCSASEMRESSEKFFYCDNNLNNFDVEGLNGKVIMAEQGISFQVNNNQSTVDIGLVAKNAINMNGSNNQNAQLSGVFWSAQNISLGSNGVSFVGSVLSTSNFTMNNFSSQEESRESWCLLEPYYSLDEAVEE